MKQKYIAGMIIVLIGIILISGCVQENKFEVFTPRPIYICGSTDAFATVISSFYTIHGNAYLVINLTDVYNYKIGESNEQLVNNGDMIKIHILGEQDYSKCPEPECPQQVEGQPRLPCKAVLCNLTDKEKFGSWNSYKLKEGDIIQLNLIGKGYDYCQKEIESIYWEAEDSKIIINIQEKIEGKYISLLKELENPLCTDGVCYVENSDMCPDGYIYEHHPIHGDSCVLICSKNETVTFVPIEVPTDTSPFPCHCLNDWKGSYEPRDKPQTFTCEK